MYGINIFVIKLDRFIERSCNCIRMTFYGIKCDRLLISDFDFVGRDGTDGRPELPGLE